MQTQTPLRGEIRAKLWRIVAKPTDLASARVDWDKLDVGISGAAAQKEKFELRGEYQYQKDVLNAVHTHFLDHDRGKLIMACGTGKTFLSLKIAEHETANRGLILVLVPSIALVGPTLCTWCEQCEVTLHPICVCSDSSVSKKKRGSQPLRLGACRAASAL